MTEPRRRLLITAAGGAALLAGAGLAWWQQHPASPGMAPADAGVGPGVGSTDGTAGAQPHSDAAPAALWAMRFEQPDGGELALASLRGKPLIINFWATWCAPCLREMPLLDRFHQAHAGRGWQVLGLAIDSPTPVREFLKKSPVGFAIGLAGMEGMALVRDLGNAQGGLPFSVLIDTQGRIVHRKLGELDDAELQRWAKAS